MTKYLLITGATGKQGGAVVDALLDSPSASDFTLLAVTRDTNSGSAQKLTSKSPSVKLVQGNLDDVPALFEAAHEVTGGEKIFGVYSVQISMGKGVTTDGEIKQGNDLIDESIKAGVSHFVYSSVERGGDEKSWTNQTPIPHFQTKYHIEHHLRDSAANTSMGWTILRPVAFMDNLVPGFPTKVFLTALRDTVGETKQMQYVATSDIGWFAAEAFQHPKEWNQRALGLAGDQFNFKEMSQHFENTTGYPAGTTFSLLGSTLMYMVTELGIMIRWFGSDGYGADVKSLRAMNPKLLDFETWLREKSGFKTN